MSHFIYYAAHSVLLLIAQIGLSLAHDTAATWQLPSNNASTYYINDAKSKNTSLQTPSTEIVPGGPQIERIVLQFTDSDEAAEELYEKMGRDAISREIKIYPIKGSRRLYLDGPQEKRLLAKAILAQIDEETSTYLYTTKIITATRAAMILQAELNDQSEQVKIIVTEDDLSVVLIARTSLVEHAKKILSRFDVEKLDDPMRKQAAAGVGP